MRTTITKFAAAPLLALACACAGTQVSGKSQTEGAGPAAEAKEIQNMAIPNVQELKALSARYAPVDLKADISGLKAGDRAALKPILQAAKALDRLFYRQMWTGNEALLARLTAEARGEAGKALLDAFIVNRGPWSELDGYTAFMDGVPARKPKGAAYYPEDASPEELEAFFDSLPEGEREKARGFYSVIRRGEAGQLTAVPYSQAYGDILSEAAGHLREAAALADDPELKKFLAMRADAFLSDDYRPSEVAWMELKGDVDPTMGPYETYLDEAMGLKAAFEAYVGIRDHEESRRLSAITAHLLDIERALPMPDHFKRQELGGLAPIAVLNQIFNAGDAAHGVQAAAYNLPNDEVVVAAKGSKRVMMKNVQQAKFEAILLPIADRVLEADDRALVDFDAFFLHILAHELSHGLGPQVIEKDGRKTSVRQELGETYSAIEEAKADLMGLFMVQRFIDGGAALGLSEMFPASLEPKLYATYLASSFRTLRFGIEEAHARSMAMQVAAFAEDGAVSVTPAGTFSVDAERMKRSVEKLLGRLLVIQATGDREAAREILRRMAVLTPELQRALGSLEGIAVDIRPNFVTAEEILGTPPAGD